MSLAIEGLQRAAQDVAGNIRDIVRGYSEEDVQNAKRLAFGQPTSKDRDAYKIAAAKGLGLAMQVFRGNSGLEIMNIDLIPPVLTFHDEMKRLAALPDPELDERVKTDALNRLKGWGQLG